MELIQTIKALQLKIEDAKSKGKSVGLVATMGALHKGHMSLVENCKTSCGFTVVSIFVNPTQFNNPEDLLKYPRTLENDLKLLEPYEVDVVFNPSVEEIYPEKDERKFDFGSLEMVMEGAFRPGHFNGVAQVVSKLFDYVSPDKAFFGEKDYQQLAIIKAMVRDYNYPVEVISCPIIREEDGLAMSSRNVRLSPEERTSALKISEALFKSKELAKTMSVNELRQWVINYVNNAQNLKVEYFEISDSSTLQSVSSWKGGVELIGCIAVFAGKIRLIDNIIY